MDKKVCVITGGGSGMGLATARTMGQDHLVILVGRTAAKLEMAVQDLKKQGIAAEAFTCDIANRSSVESLAIAARERGPVTTVIHAAGMSPHMGNAQTIMEANALGTIHVNDAFFLVMESGSCIIDVASMSGHLVPKLVLPTGAYHLSRSDPERFMRKMMGRVSLFPQKLRSSVAYGISKHFVIWFAKTDAARFGAKGIRVISVSPGNFDTPMGKLEKVEATAYLKYCAIKRFGEVAEIAQLFALLADPRLGYLTGVDIVCDGGCVASGCGK